eukprot:scaffold144404_cov26-Tisochrysis_lutea.AAC.7
MEEPAISGESFKGGPSRRPVKHDGSRAQARAPRPCPMIFQGASVDAPARWRAKACAHQHRACPAPPTGQLRRIAQGGRAPRGDEWAREAPTKGRRVGAQSSQTRTGYPRHRKAEGLHSTRRSQGCRCRCSVERWCHVHGWARGHSHLQKHEQLLRGRTLPIDSTGQPRLECEQLLSEEGGGWHDNSHGGRHCCSGCHQLAARWHGRGRLSARAGSTGFQGVGTCGGAHRARLACDSTRGSATRRGIAHIGGNRGRTQAPAGGRLASRTQPH